MSPDLIQASPSPSDIFLYIYLINKYVNINKSVLAREGVMAVRFQIAITLHLPRGGRHLFYVQSSCSAKAYAGAMWHSAVPGQRRRRRVQLSAAQRQRHSFRCWARKGLMG